MTTLLRVGAFVMVIGAILDPVFGVQRPAPTAIDVVLPPEREGDYKEAVRVRTALVDLLGTSVKTGSGEMPSAVVAIGNAKLGDVGDAKVFAVPLSQRPRVTPERASAVQTLWGQQAIVSPVFHAQQMQGKTTTFRLFAAGGATLAAIRHTWKTEEERFAPRFSFAPVASGTTTLRVSAESDVTGTTWVDVPVTTLDRPARVVVFESRPSWAAGFTRQALEADPLFEVRAVARTSRGIMTQTARGPQAVSDLDPDSADVVLVGGLDALSNDDIEALATFAARRGGTVFLIPDARVPEALRRAFDLPATEVKLLERPVDLPQGSMKLRASEVLQVSPASKAAAQAIVAAPHGNGQVMLSLALDAWRYRAESEGAFDRGWRAMVADAAISAAPAVALEIEPAIARPGDAVNVTVSVRALSGTREEPTVPIGAASIIGRDGASTPLRLWPGSRATEYVGEFTAPGPGRYDIRVDLEGVPRHDAVLVVDTNAARPAADRSRELAFLAQATGGAVVSAENLSHLAAALRALPARQEAAALRPTRSGWWMLVFAGLVSTEWALRRSRGWR